MNYVACIAEGAAETAIVDILLDHRLLIFNREDALCKEAYKHPERNTSWGIASWGNMIP